MKINTEGFIELAFLNKSIVSILFQTAHKFGYTLSRRARPSALTTEIAGNHEVL